MKPYRSLLFVPGHKRDWIDKALNSEADAVIIDLEDYVKPKDVKAALIDAGLFDRVWSPKPGADTLPTLYDMVATKKSGCRRAIVAFSRLV